MKQESFAFEERARSADNHRTALRMLTGWDPCVMCVCLCVCHEYGGGVMWVDVQVCMSGQTDPVLSFYVPLSALS